MKELPLYEGTCHTILSDVEEPGVFTDQIKWINTTEYNPERFSELALSLLKAAEPQRVTAPDDRSPAILGLMSVSDMIKLIDLLVDTAEATHHKLIYKPVSYHSGEW